MDRLPNYDNFKRLYDFYTTKGGMNPVQASGMLGNIYAESRANPGALNPQDGSDGTDSMGIIQWNSDRANALRAFAQQRGSVANDLLTQAEFSLMEGRGVERSGFMQGMNAETPEDAALGFARGYIRPAAQHIPERAGYGRMMYDIFAGGNPEGVQPGLAFDPQQAERMDRERAAIDNGEKPELTFGDSYSSGGAQEIVQRLFELANPNNLQDVVPPQQTTQPPMVGPRQGLANDTAPTVGGSSGSSPSRSSPNLGEAPNLDAALDQQFPAPEGEPKTSTVVQEAITPIAAASAYKLGMPVEDAPTTPAQIAEATSGPAPADDDDSEEAERKRNRRLIAADMLEVLSVGLGQMAVGDAVNVGPQLANQRNRYAEQLAAEQEAEAQRLAMEQQQQQAQTLATELTNMGMPGMARIAMSGPDGYEQALSTMGTIKGRKPTSVGTFESMTSAQREEVLMAAGADPRTASIGAQFPDIGADILSTLTMPDPKAEAAAAAEAAEADAVSREINSLAKIGADYIDNPAVRAAATSAFSNSTQANATAFREALAEAGAALEDAEPEALPLSEGEAAFYANAAKPEQIELAKQDGRLAEVIRNAGMEGMEAGAEEAAKAAVAATVPPERIRFLETLANNPKAMRTELALKRTEAGVQLNPTQEAILKQQTDGMAVTNEQLRTRAPMVSAMEMIVDQIAAEGYDRTAGGPFDKVLTTVQNMADQAGLPVQIQDDPQNFLARLVDAQQGEFFQNFRLAGSGATSDKEAENFMNAMVRVGDSAIKQLGLAQRLIRQYELQERAAELENEWMLRYADEPNKQLDMAARTEFVQEGVEAMGLNIYPEINAKAKDAADKLAADLASGNITDETVVRYVDESGNAQYVMFKDLENARMQE